MSSPAVPKAILYAWPTSVWSTVPQLCLVEKGYGEDEYIIKHVDISRGENFAPSYLKINPNGTIPTLVVPTFETTGDDVETRYRSLKDTISICDFLDQARSAGTSNTTSEKPAPALAPATIEGKSTSDAIIALVHGHTIDPNFLNLSARNQAELEQKAAGKLGKSITNRRQQLAQYLEEVSNDTKVTKLLEGKQAANEALWSIFNGQAGDHQAKAYFEHSVRAWTADLPTVLTQIEGLIKGPYVLGDQVSLCDLHLASWLTRLISISSGRADKTGIDKLEAHLGGAKIGSKIKGLWAAFVERESFQKVLVPSCDAFLQEK